MLLKFRQRSEKEIYQRLKKKKFDDNTIKETVTFLKDHGFINDTDFAKAWIESRLKRPLGLRRIRNELKLKGIDKDIIESLIGAIKKNYLEEDIVRALTEAQFNRLKNLEPQKAKQRVFSYLIRRGFSTEIIMQEINNLKDRPCS